jgi:hypothetical protein
VAAGATLFVITDGNGNHRVGCTSGTVASRVESMQTGNAYPLRCVHSEPIPAEMGGTILAVVRNAMRTRRIHRDWYRADEITVLGAVARAVAHAAALTAPPSPVPSAPSSRQAPTGADADPAPSPFEEELEDARSRVNLAGKVARNLRHPWE